MKLLHLLSFAGLLFSCSERKPDTKNLDSTFDTPAKETVIAFHRDTLIYIKRGHEPEKKLLVGYEPCVSPDGKRLTFLKYGGNARQIYLVDLETMKEERLQVDSDNFYGAVWSPDGKYIAFNLWDNGNWAIGVIKSDNTGFAKITGPPGYGLEEPTWSRDGKSIIASNLVDVFEFDLHGTQLQQIDSRKILGEDLSLSGDNRIWISSDKTSFFFNAGVSEAMEDVEGPVYAIFYFNMQTKESVRISPKKMYASELYMVGENKLLFQASHENEQQSNIYLYDFESRKLTQVIKNGSSPSGSIENHETGQ